MSMELGMHLRFPVVRRSSTVSGQVAYISVLLAHGRPSECSRSCAHVGNRGKSRSCSHSSYTPSSGKPSKRFLSAQVGGFGGSCGLLILLGSCHSGEGGLLTLLGSGLGLGLRGLNRGPRSAESTVGRGRLTAFLYRGGSFV